MTRARPAARPPPQDIEDRWSTADAGAASDPDRSRPRRRRPRRIPALRQQHFPRPAPVAGDQLRRSSISWPGRRCRRSGAIQQRKDRIAKDIDDATAMQTRRHRRRGAREGAREARARRRGSPRRPVTSSPPRRKPSARRRRRARGEFVEAERQIAATRQQAMAMSAPSPRGDRAIVERLIGRPAKPEAIAARSIRRNRMSGDT